MDIKTVENIPALDTWLKERNLNGHWNHDERREQFTPFMWKWDDIREGLMKASELVPMDETGRRTVQMRIPILISRSGFTAWGVELARQANLTLIGQFSDTNAPAGYAPFNVQVVAGHVIVTFAKPGDQVSVNVPEDDSNAEWAALEAAL